MQSARRYFGSASDLRKNLLPEIYSENRRKRATEARNRLRNRQRKEFRGKLNELYGDLPEFAHSVEEYEENLTIDTEDQIPEAQRTLSEFRERLSDFRLPGAPKNLGSLGN